MRLSDAPRDAAGRPIVGACHDAIITALARAAPHALARVDPGAILVISGAARMESSASIRPFASASATVAHAMKPRIVLSDREILYEICLRPRFFLEGDAHTRLTILAHELWHMSPAFDGTLAEDRRHDRIAPGEIEREAQAIAERVLEGEAAALVEEVLGFRGELRMGAWTRRPPSREPPGRRAPRDYGERDLYLAIVEQR